MKLPAVILILLIAVLSLDARTVTSRSNLKVRREVKESVDVRLNDTVFQPDSSVVLAGYDKMLRSSRETFFLVNGSSRHITAISLTFTYYDMQGRMLHSRTSDIVCDIPAGETRQLSLKAWDTQQLFYFHGSPAPRRAATPYSVAYNIRYIVVTKQ